MKSLLKKTLKQIGLLSLIKRVLSKYLTRPYNLVIGNAPVGVQFHTVSGYESFLAYRNSLVDILEQRAAIDQQVLAASKSPFFVKGNNFLTGKSNNSFFVAATGNLREDFCCLETGLNNRVRATLYAIHQSCGIHSLSNKQVYLTEAVTRLTYWFREQTKHVCASEYLGEGIKGGTIVNGIEHQDITHLSYADESFDLSVCLEVLEHVPDFRKGFSELARVTKPGGKVFITVPFIEDNQQTTIRASFNEKGELIHHLPPEYHGDPVNAEGGILCFQHFGWDVLDMLKSDGFADVKVHLVWSASELMLGKHIIVIEAIR